jgi:hypothetical protein
MKKIFKFIKNSFITTNDISNIRLNCTAIIFTGCLCMITLTVAFMLKPSITSSDIAVFGGTLVAFTGLGL